MSLCCHWCWVPLCCHWVLGATMLSQVLGATGLDQTRWSLMGIQVWRQSESRWQNEAKRPMRSSGLVAEVVSPNEK
ncbi:hypothetical protein E2C01_000694 [Portunus trituberculatus]|uniref:Secreted protein n=1 Tax=Portunus trituberculatus TaxID=210409 RepID=A0A5B7CFU9_PORTR|nr:hypothetical protein [Portunus trituberculatus]